MPFDSDAAAQRRIDDPSLSPYDTGEVLQPVPWASALAWGSVDFDNEEGQTELTLRVYPSGVDDETLVLDIDSGLLRKLKIVVNDGTVGTISEDGGFELSWEQL